MCDCIQKETENLNRVFRNRGEFVLNDNKSFMIPFTFTGDNDNSVAHVQVKYCPFCGEPQKGQKPSWHTVATVFRSVMEDGWLENFLFTREFNVVRPEHCDTDPKIAIKLANYLDLQNGDFVLEPGAGNGNLISAVLSVAETSKKKITIGYCEKNGKFLPGLHENFPEAEFLCSDINDNKITVDKIIMNPPFKDMEFMEHLITCFNLLTPRKGVLVSIVPTFTFYIPKYSDWLNEHLFHKEEIKNFHCGYGAELSIIILKNIKNKKSNYEKN